MSELMDGTFPERCAGIIGAALPIAIVLSVWLYFMRKESMYVPQAREDEGFELLLFVFSAAAWLGVASAVLSLAVWYFTGEEFVLRIIGHR